jgi:hypothetical protein
MDIGDGSGFATESRSVIDDLELYFFARVIYDRHSPNFLGSC